MFKVIYIYSFLLIISTETANQFSDSYLTIMEISYNCICKKEKGKKSKNCQFKC